MSKLTATGRNALPGGKFVLPGDRYPIDDAAHARNAKARAAQQEKAGHLSPRDKKAVDAKAEKVLKVDRDGPVAGGRGAHG